MSVVWLTGLSGSGKTSIATVLTQKLNCNIIDGDVVRQTCPVEFSAHGASNREKKFNWISDYIVSQLKTNKIIVATFVSPIAAERLLVRTKIEHFGYKFIEVYVNASLETCERRDVKGLYKRAKNGEDIKLAGLTEKYEAPVQCQVVCHTETSDVDDCANQILKYVQEN